MRKIKQYRKAMPGVCMVFMLSGCASLTEKDGAMTEGVMMTKPLQVDLKPDFRSVLESPPTMKPSAPVMPKPKNNGVQQPNKTVSKQNRVIAQQRGVTKQNKNSCGNEPAYTLKGRSYQVLPSAKGYRAEGMASRYDVKYQGSATAGCERYDLQAFTAAHRTLPLPSFVRVTNLQSNRSVIVKVNDRGPFDNDGLIRLSSAAAIALGMNGAKGAARVRVEAVSENIIAGAKPQRGMTRKVSQVRRPASMMKRTDPRQAAEIKQAKQRGKSFFVIVKNYDAQADALDMFVRLTSVGLKKTELASAMSKGRNVHQVRVGPLYTQDQIDSVKESLSSNGLATFRVIQIDQ